MRTVRWLVIGILVLVALGWLLRWVQGPEVAPGAALVVPLRGAYVEAPDAPLAARLLGFEQRSLLGTLSQLRKAERDERLAHVVLDIGDLEIGWGKAQELRDAILGLREAGRHPVALLSVAGFGANLEYYVASAAEEVYLAPGGGPPLVGLAQEFLFLGGLWEKLGLPVAVAQAGRYKGAAEQIAASAMTDAFREQAEALLDSVDAQFVAGIAEARGVEPQRVREAFERASSDPAVLQALGLASGVATRAELLAKLGDPEEVTAREYAAVDPARVGFSPEAAFALVYVAGPITTGEGSTSRTGRPVAAADAVIEAIEQAAEDDAVRAIVLRVDSPGGGSFPSELMWRAVQRARERKPVVASFSDYAASGGYYVASAASRIVSQPATLTGSIGVFAVRPALGPLVERFGIGVEVMQRAPHAELNLMTPDLSPDTRAWLEDDVLHVYEVFLGRVAEGRGLDKEAVREIAEGRVWTGEQAHEVGLVDAVGGLRRAVELARAELGLGEDVDVELRLYPPPKPLAEQIAEALQLRVAQVAAASVPWGAGTWRAARGRAAAWLEAVVEAAGQGGAVLVPPAWIEIH